MQDRSSRPHASPTRTSPAVVRQIVGLRWRHRLGPVQIGGRLGLPASTVHAVLVRCRLNRLSRIDRVTGEPIRRYEHDHPGSLLHVDVTKFGNIPDGGGHRFVGRRQGAQNKRATPGLPRSGYKPRTGIAYLHTVLDDHSRLAYVEICPDEKAVTAAGVLQRAVAWFAEHGIHVERVLSDNGACYRSLAWRQACLSLGIIHKRTRPYRPQTNGKLERFHRTSPTAGPTAAPTAPRPNAAPPYPAGCTSTITTESTPRSVARPPADLTTCLDITSRFRGRRPGRWRLLVRGRWRRV
jgi:transposase InsO family protein